MSRNYANKQVCDVDIRYLATGKPFLHFSNANTTGQTVSGESVYAYARGKRKVAFPEPMEGTMTIEAQVMPFELYALMSNGVIYTSGSFFGHEVVACVNNGELVIEGVPDTNVSIYVYPEGNITAATEKTGTYANNKITVTGVTSGNRYEVFYTIKRDSGIKRVRFSDDLIVNDFVIDMTTLWKDEDGVYTPVIYRAWKATPQRNFEMSESSSGDPVTITITIDMLTDKNGNFFDMIEDTENTSTIGG